MVNMTTLLLVCSLVLLSCVVVTTQEQHDTTLQENVVKWLRENGGFFHEALEFRRSPPFGVATSAPIRKGEILTTVPWKCVIAAGTDRKQNGVYCDTIRLLVEEMRKGNESFFGPYVKYLASLPPVQLPKTWSPQGRALLKKILGKDGWNVDESVQDDWVDYCGGKPSDSFEIQAALLLYSRGDDDTLTPVYDMHNHRNGKWFNTEFYQVNGVKHEIKASRDIKAGEQLYLSYHHCPISGRFSNNGTSKLFRDYGFLEEYPQRWIFHKQEFGFDVDIDENDGTLKVTWLDKDLYPEFDEWYEVTDKSIAFLVDEIDRLNQINETELEPLLKATDGDVPRSELQQTARYVDALVIAMTEAVKKWTADASAQNVSEAGDAKMVGQSDERALVDDEDEEEDDEDDNDGDDECPAGMAVKGKCVVNMKKW